MGYHGFEVMDDGCIDRDDAGIMGVFVAGREAAYARVVRTGAAAVNAGLFLDGSLGGERRKTEWMRAKAAVDPGPWRQQALLERDRFQTKNM